jgi:hypothetical protein
MQARGPYFRCMKNTADHPGLISYPWQTVALTPLASHPWLRIAPQALYLVPLNLLEVISSGRGQEGASTDLGDGSTSLVPLDTVWMGIKKQGMRDPLVVAIGLATGRSTIRLESGNHRIFPAGKDGLTHLPVIGLASSQSILNSGNGDHIYPFDRSGLDEWLTKGGRSPEFFDPYPHPVDLRAALGPMSGSDAVWSVDEIEVAHGDSSGLVKFRPRSSR